MQVKIRIDRAAAIRAGRNTFGDTIVEISPSDLTPDEREILLLAPLRDGIADLTRRDFSVATSDADNLPTQPRIADADDPLAAAHAWLDWLGDWHDLKVLCDAREAEKKRLEDEKIQAAADAYVSHWSAQPPESFMVWSYREGGWVPTLPAGGDGEPKLPYLGHNPEIKRDIELRLAAKLEDADALCRRRAEEAAQRKEEQERKEQERQGRRAEQLAEWIRDHGTENQQGRFRIGALPEEEVLNDIRAQAYAPLDSFKRFEKIRFNDLDHNEDCYGPGPLDCEALAGSDLSAEQFDVYAQIEESAPEGAVLSVRSHACECSACGAGLVRAAVKVELTVGELIFSREYALEPEG